MTATPRQAASPDEIALAKTLFAEYQEAIGVDLCFQSFEKELAELPGAYAPPSGRLLLAFSGAQPAGCIALPPLAEGTCEMKRLYVRPAFQGTGVGRRLVEALLQEARAIGYRGVRLDTLPSMRAAQALYESLGFVDIPPYNDHPIEGTRFMERTL